MTPAQLLEWLKSLPGYDPERKQVLIIDEKGPHWESVTTC